MKINLFDIKNGVARITNHCHTIWYLKDIIDMYGEANAVKIFIIFQYMADMNPDSNPFANVNEVEKIEVIIRAVCPELSISIDWDDELILECIELTRKLFETPTYRTYLASKRLIDKFTVQLDSVSISLYKDDGNVGEIKKGYEMYEVVKEGAKRAFKEFEQENGKVIGRGGRTVNSRNIGGKSKELE